jgi:Lar family restriction alleviation protein
MPDELKPCPFCGKQPSEEYCQRRYDFDFAIECECGACLSQCEWDGGPGQTTKERTIEQWNTRATEDALRAQLAEAVALLRELLDSQRDHTSEYQINTNAGCAIAEVLARVGEGS